MNIADSLRAIPVAELDLSGYVTTEVGTTVGETVSAMNAAGRSSALVVEGETLVGIFTQWDVVMRVLAVEDACDLPVDEVMTHEPRSVSSEASVSDAMSVMNEAWVRSVPVVHDGHIVGNFTYYTAMKLVAELLSDKAVRSESDLSAQHGLMFVDFTGVRTDPAVTVRVDDTLETAVQQMRWRGVGSVLVVSDRETLVGVLTEFDLQTKVACTGQDLGSAVETVMQPHPLALDARSPIADAVAGMARHEISHVVLVAETGKPVGMADFNDVVEYFETSLAALG